ncbi:MAG: transcription-repair coupling factor, partial [Deltaproteobacteria bacterium]|nr:transcription-repair coupling factor [Deltaproteobacteria bacterium]
FVSLINLAVEGRMGDFLLLEYKDADKLYVPADRLNLIQKYIGPEGKQPSVDRLGGLSWRQTKKRVKRRLVEIVRELVELYAARKVKKGFSFSGRDELFREFEATFEFDETPDQEAAIEDVLQDMQRSRPMDRLVCGDVGYGKTEVALRAAFKAVMDGKQVALLVPTTVLAEQHGQTFHQRLDPYPVRVEILSRFKTQADQKKILADLEKGLIDVVIGTHRLLSKDVIFRNLGLVIVDEEHRFGVNHKEKLKELRQTVDVLALTATPIPRTLQMSLFTIRDLSVINTPPQHRQAITTYLSNFDPAAVQEAIGRELDRGGQVFFVHNRVQDIVKVANLVQKLAPTARVEVAHGQMSERVLEKVMLKFIQREVDVLVCTTIIESGLDIPSANTIIINNADKLGLAQTYQLRGRVGRSAERAYAYLLIPAETTLSRDAQKRLKVLMEFSHLGAGFQIAMRDLEIRGGGNLLGRAQSGNVAPVGYEMYLSLMEQAVAELKGQAPVERIEPEINLPYSAYLPADYVAEPNQRLLLYRRLSAIEDEAQLADLIAEMTDRFGPLPQEAKHLTEVIKIKLDLRRAGVTRLDVAKSQAALTFSHETPVEAKNLVALVRSAPKRFKLIPDQQLLVNASNPLAEVKRTLKFLLASCNK